jgi:hypothetical protein
MVTSVIALSLTVLVGKIEVKISFDMRKQYVERI